MATIYLPERFSDNFGDAINAIFELLVKINELDQHEEVILDYTHAKFTHPFFSLAVPLIIKQLVSNEKHIKLNSSFLIQGVSTYMRTIHFPNGLNPEKIKDRNYTKHLSVYENKSYIPIITFPVGESKDSEHIRNEFLSAVNKLLINICKISGNVLGALMYLIDEAVNNVLHHSYDDFGYIHAQYYESKGFIDIVIADTGRTFLESYMNSERHQQVTNHEEAMKAALAGLSTKSNNIDRGYGISTSKEMLTKGLNGKYFLFSGNVLNIHTSERNNVVNLNDKIFWQGMFLCLRIPVIAKPDFNPADYYE